MQELIEMVQQLRDVLEAKQTALQERLEGIDSYVLGELINRKRAIDFFEDSTRQVEVSPFGKKMVIANFKKDQQQIMDRIAGIGGETK